MKPLNGAVVPPGVVMVTVRTVCAASSAIVTTNETLVSPSDVFPNETIVA